MKKIQTFCVLAGFMLLLAACDGAPSYEYYDSAAIEEPAAEEMADSVVVEREIEVVKEVEVEKVIEIQATAPASISQNGDETVSLAEEQGVSPRRRTRLIIKDGNIAITVESTQSALDAVGQLVIGTGGYIIEQNAYKLDGFNYVTMQIGVPVEEFERAMEALRRLGTVTQDSASGIDVTDEFIDLESRLGNLKIKQERLRTFMEEAKKIEDVLKIEAELSKVEEELNVIQGRINFLKDRSSFSTISIQLNPWVPTATPSPTATMTPTSTPTPLPTPNVWRPGDTAQIAAVELQETSQGIANGLIYTGIVCGPWLLLILLAGWGLYSLNRRFGNRFEISRLSRQTSERGRRTVDQLQNTETNGEEETSNSD